MAPPKKRTRGWLEKERIIEPSYSHRERRKRRDIPRRAQAYQSIDVPKLVHGLLSIEKHNQAVKRMVPDKKRVEEFDGRMRKYQHNREPSYDTSDPPESIGSTEESEYMESDGKTSNENLTDVIGSTNGSASISSRNSSVSNISVEPTTLANSIDNTAALLKKKSFVQIINNYIKAGIEEGKRQAKKYIRKALSFGVKSGYLIPADPQGQVIRVSAKLIQCRKADAEARRNRRRARKGLEQLRSVEQKEARHGRPSNLHDNRHSNHYRADSLEPPLPKKRRKASRSRSPRINKKPNINLNKTKSRKSSMDVDHRGVGKKKLPVSRKKEKQDTHKGKDKQKRQGRQQRARKVDEDTKGKTKRRSARSRSPHKQEKDNRSKSHRDRNDKDRDKIKSLENETNQRTVADRRKSSSSRDSISRVKEEESPGNFKKENDVGKTEETCNENIGLGTIRNDV